ncbi:LysR family transcriptional regulator [Pseudomonas sp. MH10]|uniref:LysR family transcriptional regulator n=1 Tax=Pseudomonas sp. MH10 TaxID=3048627 RepID=UPI002AC97893|nr:LysR family transcriptional regulator [Pseudomonas sp. MH10]MEB0041305.1 LysR family transcriptional regulator [Pseudomonas sp. MH10]WPX63799.1 LysR family transcriptional regulator [Pseudomonas sp. MH10]
MSTTERLKGIAMFVGVANAGSFTAAAERLNLSNSAVSKGIARLEGRLGTRLFERTTRRLALTEAGASYYSVCTRVLADLEEAETELDAQRAEPSGNLRIDLPTSYGRLHVMPLILAFVEGYPNLRAHLSFTDRFVDLLEERIDLSVRIGGADAWPAALNHCCLGTERVTRCASPAYLEKRGRPQTIEDLAEHACVLYGKADGSSSPWFFADGAGKTQSRPIPGRIVVGNAEALVSAVMAGSGIAQFATWLVKEQLRNGELVEVLPDLATDGLPLYLAWPRSRETLPKVHRLIERLSAALTID